MSADAHKSRRVLFRAALLVVTGAAALVYVPSLENDFVNWDDPITVVENRHIRSLDTESLEWMVTTKLNGNRIPFTWLTRALVYRFGGRGPFAHHLVNLLIHAFNALLAFLLFLAILDRAAAPGGDAAGAESGKGARPPPGGSGPGLLPPASSTGRSGPIVTAAGAALFWALHPLRVESVAWITELKDVGCALFFLAALLAWLRYAGETGGRGKRRRTWYALCLASAAASLLFKSMAVTLPVVLLLLDWWPLKRLRGRIGAALAEKAPFFVLSTACGILTIGAQERGITPLDWVPLDFRIMNAFHSVFFYLEKTLAPLDLAPLYPIVDPGRTAFSPGYILAAAAVLAVTCAAFLLARRRRPEALAAWLFFLVTLGPVLGIIQVGAQAAADRYTYIPQLSLALLAAAGAAALSRRLDRLAPALGAARPVPVLWTAGLCGLALLTVGQTGVWKNSVALWEHQTRIFPGMSHTAYSNLAKAYRKAGRLEEAAAAYRKALGIPAPYTAYSHDGLGCVLLDMDRKRPNDPLVDEAIREFRKAIAADPAYPAPHRNLWYAYRRKALGKEGAERAALERAALDEVRRAIRLDPGYAAAYNNLGISLSTDRGSSKEAEEAFRKAAGLDPGNPEFLSNLAGLLLRERRTDEAVRLYREAVRAAPGEARLAFNLANALEKAGKAGEAARWYARCLELDPRLAAAHIALARLCLRAGRTAGARGHVRAAEALGAAVDPALKAAVENR